MSPRYSPKRHASNASSGDAEIAQERAPPLRVAAPSAYSEPIEAAVDQILEAGFAHLEGPFDSVQEARATSDDIAHGAESRSALGEGMPPLVPVGEFAIPPEGAPGRDFQLLHLDFGLSIEAHRPRDVARYTALHVPIDRPATAARTRIVGLAAFLGQRKWPSRDALTHRLVVYGRSGGARSGSTDYVEGILARLVEAAAEAGPSLPNASECLCGQELESLAEEREHFAMRGLRLEKAETLVDLQPGQLLVLDNLATAHGRIGRRRPHELHQVMLGHRRLVVELQATLRDRVLRAFARVDGERRCHAHPAA